MASNTNYAQKITSPNLNINGSVNSINHTNSNYCTNIDTFTYDEAVTTYDVDNNQVVTTSVDLDAPTVSNTDTTSTTTTTTQSTTNQTMQPCLIVSQNGYVFFQGGQSGLPPAIQAYMAQTSSSAFTQSSDPQNSLPPGLQSYFDKNGITLPQVPMQTNAQNQSQNQASLTFSDILAKEGVDTALNLRNSFNGGKGAIDLLQTQHNKNIENFSISSTYFGDEFAYSQMEHFFDDIRAQYPDGSEDLALFDELYNNYGTKEKIYKAFLEKYNTTATEYNGYLREWDELTAQMNRDLAGCQTAESQNAVYEEYYKKYTELQGKMDACKQSLVGENGDPSKINLERQYFGNSVSAMKQYGSEAGSQALTGFLIKETSNFVSGYVNSRREGNDPDEALADAIIKLEQNTGKNALTSVGQGVGYFGGMFFTQGTNKNFAGTTGLVLSNTVGVGYDYFNEKDPNKRTDILIKGGMQIGGGAITAYGGQYILPQMIKSGTLTSTKLADGALPFSGATLYSYGSTVGTVGSWFFTYDDLGEWAANVDATEVSAMFLNMAAYTIGDGIEVYFFGKTTGTIGMILAIPANYAAEPVANMGENLGYWYYDFEKDLENFGSDVYDFVHDFEQALEDTGAMYYDLNHGIVCDVKQFGADLKDYGVGALVNDYEYQPTNITQGNNTFTASERAELKQYFNDNRDADTSD